MPSENLDNLIAICGVYQNTTNLAEQLAYYGHMGFVIEPRADLAEGEILAESWFNARGVKRENLKQTVAMRLPHDPYMHIWFQSWDELSTDPVWPPVYNQTGCRGFTLLVADISKELGRISRDFKTVTLVQDQITVQRKWGPTHSALLRDPDGNFIELMTIDGSNSRAAQPVPHGEKGFLHFMLNCPSENFAETKRFYCSFGMEHDCGVDFKKDGRPDGDAYFQQQYIDGFGAWPIWGECSFLRGKRDPSYMHLELLEAREDLQVPGRSPPTWAQRGIARYCIKVPDFQEELQKSKQRGSKIYVETQRGK
ncbi:hypothetical protein FNAPI_5858 [Fusarium napiforme]|uniref:VOC domain-containing protein n=1 Tax=Fusarium napiforme TaxID=42672 RepID=A0A8H5JJQ9_9HYPO|nr:hypothetical protein FNAPI_5858 [Fusarium napiforme]